MRFSIRLVYLGSPFLVGCQTAVPVTKAVDLTPVSTNTVPCPLAASDAQLAGWRQVQAKGFAFCVPATWHADSGSKVWKSGDASIEWATGDYRPSHVAQKVIITERPVGPGSNPAMYGPPSMPPGVTIRQFTDRVDGRTVRFWYNKIDDLYYTGAVWSAPAFSITGKSKREDLAGVEMQIYRTVRVE